MARRWHCNPTRKRGTRRSVAVWGLPVLLFALAAGAMPAQAEATATKPKTAEKTAVVLLGTGTPRPDPKASGPATAVLVGSRVFVVDAGPGTERQLAAAKLPINGVTALFITHLHSDHTLGYPDLILTSWVMGRTKPFPVYGPRGLQRMTDHLLAAFAEDIQIRTEGLEHKSPNGYKVNVHEITRGTSLPARRRPGDRVSGAARQLALGLRLSLRHARPLGGRLRRHASLPCAG